MVKQKKEKLTLFDIVFDKVGDGNIIKSFKFVKSLPTNSHEQRLNDVLPYTGRPLAKIDTYDAFIAEINSENKSYEKYKEENKEDFPNDEDNEKIDMSEFGKKCVPHNNIKTVYAEISYPLTNNAYIECTLAPNVNLTFGMLLYIYTVAYQLVYKIEDAENCPQVSASCVNMGTTAGYFGIWGHYICDLLYNGSSTIMIGGDYIKCEFHCDS